MTDFVKYTFWFVLLLVAQILIFDNIQISVMLTPYIYVLFILILPLQIRPTLILLCAFALGLCMDLFTNGIFGAHTVACVAMAYLRTLVTKAVSPESRYDHANVVSPDQLKPIVFVFYTFLLVIVHHAILCFIEVFSLKQFGTLFLRVIISSIVSTVLILFIYLLFSKRKKR